MPPKEKKGLKRKELASGSPFHFDLQKIHTKLASNFQGEVDPKATIYLTAVIQYVAAEMIEVSGNKAREKSGRKKAFVIKDEDVRAATESDAELKKLMDDIAKK